MAVDPAANHQPPEAMTMPQPHSPFLRRILHWGLHRRTLADDLPSVLYWLTTNGKMAVAIWLGVYLLLLAIWIPFWLLSWLLGELGVYAFLVVTVFVVGRAVIRMIAFPGSSYRVTQEMEREIQKYAVRMLESAATGFVDLATSLLALPRANNTASDPQQQQQQRGTTFSYYEIPGLWKRTKQYRDRVVAVVAQVLQYILEQPRNVQAGRLTPHGNNPLAGDIGTLSGLTPQARQDGRDLWTLCTRLLQITEQLEDQASPILNHVLGTSQSTLSDTARQTAQDLYQVSCQLQDFVESLQPPNDGNDEDSDESEEDLTVEAVRRKMEEKHGSTLEAAKSAVSSILPMLDPPPHTSIFGFDLQRGFVLARYKGARQLWVRRWKGGMLDVLHFPARRADNAADTAPTRNTKAVLYCNPNAGLIEVATGLSMAGGNVASDAESMARDSSWVDFYTENGLDVYLFNYAGFGRSYGTTLCSSGKEEAYVPGALARLKRIFRACFLSFLPTADTLREDGMAMGSYLLNEGGVEQLVIHGESIGGVAASGAANHLTRSSTTANKVSLLLCDRTFCNLEATAQRLVGGWSGYAIRMLAPFWNTDVAGSFLGAACPKVLANDSADTIIADAASLKSGIALWKEIQGGLTSTRGIGWIVEAPLEYRMAEWENVCVNDSRYVRPSLLQTQAPVWPSDKRITKEEAFHFAACAKRIGKLASQEKRILLARQDMELGELGNSSQRPILAVWDYLSSCDGLAGAPLGIAVRGGFDCTVAWLCSTLTFGGQKLVEQAEQRLGAQANSPDPLQVTAADFDARPPGFEAQESETMQFPKPIPEVVQKLMALSADHGGDPLMSQIDHEVTFVVGVLNYIVARLSSGPEVESCRRNKSLQKGGGQMQVGCFLNLNCGHNNSFAVEEKKKLKEILARTVA